uniref:Large ribosomal subunit protein mL46 n=1 Tax=Hucho hucho TaxID=62062 RepID=A0A4W5MCI1_9TELE
MAPPCWRMAATRPLCSLVPTVRRTGPGHTAVRQMALRAAGPAAAQTQGGASRWRLHGAVCLQRLPVVSQERNPVEHRFAELMHQVETNSEMLHDQQVETNSEIQTDVYLCVPDVGGTALGSVERCLGDSLVLLVQQAVGKENIWLLPQAQWEAGETLRQTAERVLTSLPGADFKATFLGNTPCGVYKYKFPKDVRTARCVGAKVFFFKALLSGGSISQSASQKGAFLWAKKTELQGYLKPAYLEKVRRFILDL